MTKIQWTTSSHISVGRHVIPCATNLEPGYNQGSGVKRDSRAKLLLKKLLHPFYKARDDLLVDGFIEREVGRRLAHHVSSDTVFLEIGCGDMSLRRFLPAGVQYNGLDLELSEFQVRRVLQHAENLNIVLASATSIPVESSTVSLIASTETFEHIPRISQAISEIHRIATPNAKLICSIPNNHCHKYQKKGRHPGHVNDWTYHGFVEFMKSRRFELIRGFMKGWWIPLPVWLARTSYQLPLTSTSEFQNTNFFFTFRAVK